MPLERQVCSLELAKKLKELGVKQESLFYWGKLDLKDWEIEIGVEEYSLDFFGEGEHEKYADVSAFTVAELGEMLPVLEYNFQTAKHESTGQWFITNYQNTLPPQEADTEADARAKLLIYLIKNKLITI